MFYTINGAIPTAKHCSPSIPHILFYFKQQKNDGVKSAVFYFLFRKFLLPRAYIFTVRAYTRQKK